MDLSKIKSVAVSVTGDIMLDRYVSGVVSRISPEAPIPVVNHERDRDILGGAANVARNVADFGAGAQVCSVIGAPSEETEILLAELEQIGVSCANLVQDLSRPTTTKTRVIGNGQQIVRIDREVNTPISGEVEEGVIGRLASSLNALIVADYAKGVVTESVVSTLRQLARSEVLVAVDPHPHNRQDWSGVDIFKPNLSELINITGVQVELERNQDPRENTQLEHAINVLYKEYNIKHLLITLSEHGMVYVYENREFHWEPTRAREVFDVSGAGDTVITYFTMALAAGWPGVEATQLANIAAGLVVQKLGTASLTYEEVESAWVAVMKSV